MKAVLASLAIVAASAQAADVAPGQFTKIEFFGLNCTVCEDGLKDKFELLPEMLSSFKAAAASSFGGGFFAFGLPWLQHQVR